MKSMVVVFACVFGAVVGPPVCAATDYNDPEGHFVIAVPDGWEVRHETGANYYEITDGEDSFLISYLPGQQDLDGLYDLARSTLQTSLNGGQENGKVEEVQAVRQVKTEDGTLVKVGGYSGGFSYGGTAITMYGYAAASSLKEGGITVISAMDEEVFRGVSEQAMAMFGSIRNPKGE